MQSCGNEDSDATCSHLRAIKWEQKQVNDYLGRREAAGGEAPAIPSTMWLCVLGLFLGTSLVLTPLCAVPAPVVGPPSIGAVLNRPHHHPPFPPGPAFNAVGDTQAWSLGRRMGTTCRGALSSLVMRKASVLAALGLAIAPHICCRR